MAENNLKKNKQGYGYKYTDLAQIHEYLEANNMTYYQYIETDNSGTDYIMTIPIVNGEEKPARRGCRVIQASLSGKSNPAQEQGSALTYARRYSLLMCFGLATEDDDAASLTKKEQKNTVPNEQLQDTQIKIDVMKLLNSASDEYVKGVCDHYNVSNVADMSVEQCKDYISCINKQKEGKKE